MSCLKVVQKKRKMAGYDGNETLLEFEDSTAWPQNFSSHLGPLLAVVPIPGAQATQHSSNPMAMLLPC